MSNLFNKNLINIVCFICFICVGFSFNVCNVDISEPWFNTKDSSGQSVLIVDSSGDTFLQGKSHTSSGSGDSLIIDGLKFNLLSSKASSFNDRLSSVPLKSGVEIKNHAGDLVTLLASDGSINTKGYIVGQDLNANCKADGQLYCNSLNPKVYENRDYFCDILGPRSGACKYNIVNSYNCELNDFKTCSGEKVKIFNHYSCGYGSCKINNVQNLGSCGSYQYCYGSASCANYIWKTVGSFGSCPSSPCGSSFTLSRTVICTRAHDGSVVSNSKCNSGSKPATISSCSSSACASSGGGNRGGGNDGGSSSSSSGGGRSYGGGDGSEGVGESSGYGCFPEDQLVLTVLGEVKISELKVGDEVISFDEVTGNLTTSRVGEVIVHGTGKYFYHDFEKYNLVELSVADEYGEVSKINVTMNHLFYNPLTGIYQMVEEFSLGDEFYGVDGLLNLVAIEILINSNENKILVYDIHMDIGPKNYFVNGILVHNKL